MFLACLIIYFSMSFPSLLFVIVLIFNLLFRYTYLHSRTHRSYSAVITQNCLHALQVSTCLKCLQKIRNVILFIDEPNNSGVNPLPLETDVVLYSRASLLRAPLLREFGYNAVGCGPRFSSARGKCQMGLLKPT